MQRDSITRWGIDLPLEMSCSCFSFRKKKSPNKLSTDPRYDVSKVQKARCYTYEELQIATHDFKYIIGKGGFGYVFKGILEDDTPVAVKVLSATSKQGLREFFTEIKMIADIEHPNLVKLYGYCTEGDHRILVYGFVAYNSLSQTLFGPTPFRLRFNWPTRRKICIGVARGLVFLHDEVEPNIIHRDIKVSNILIDENFNPIISDFGLAKLIPDNITHISTRVAGTVGYLAPEYVAKAQLTKQADIYSFGVLLLEIVCGRLHFDKDLHEDEQCLLEWLWTVYRVDELGIMVDPSMEPKEHEVEEACIYMKIGLLCTQENPHLRPRMSVVLQMLKGRIEVGGRKITKPGFIKHLMEFKENRRNERGEDSTESMSLATMTFTSIEDRSYAHTQRLPYVGTIKSQSNDSLF